MAFKTVTRNVCTLAVVGLLTGMVGMVMITPSVARGAHLSAKGASKPPAPAKKPKAAKPPAGGANQVEGLNGKVGQMLFDGKWRFQVQSVQEGLATYTLKVLASEQDYARYHDVADEDPSTHIFTPKEGNTLVAIKCIAKNAQNKQQQLDFYLNEPKTALTDDQGNSYPPIAYDMISKGAWMTKPLLPGSGEDMTILFAVPTGTKLKDLVVTLKNWSDHKGHDVRVSLR